MYRTVLISIMAVGLIGAAVGGTTLALFSDMETSEDNEFTTGTLDLLVDWEETYNGEHVETQELTNDPGAIFQFDDIKPGDKGQATISLHLEDNPGWIWMDMIQTANENVHCSEPQQKALGVDSAEECPEEGNLADYLEFTIYSTDESGELQSEDDIIFQGTASELEGQLSEEGILLDGDRDTEGVQAFEGGETGYVAVKWNLPIETGNIVQGDMKKYDIEFYTEQERHNPQEAEEPVEDVEYNDTNWQVDLVSGDVIEDLSEETYSDRGTLEYAAHGFTGEEGPVFDHDTRQNQVDFIVDDSAELELLGDAEDPMGTISFETEEEIGDDEEATFVSYENTGTLGWTDGSYQVYYNSTSIDVEGDEEYELDVELPAAEVVS